MTDLQTLPMEFWELLVSVWQDGIQGVDFGRVLVALGILIFFYILRGLFARIVVAAAGKWAARTQTQVDDLLVEALAPAHKLMVFTIGVFVAGG